MKCKNSLKKTVNNLAEKYAMLVERRIDEVTKSTEINLKYIHDDIQMLGCIVAMLERFSHIERDYFCNDCDDYNSSDNGDDDLPF